MRLKQGCLLGLLLTASQVQANETNKDYEERLQQLEQQLQIQQQQFNERIETLTDLLESNTNAESENKVHIGGYGELHYRNLTTSDTDIRELDFH